MKLNIGLHIINKIYYFFVFFFNTIKDDTNKKSFL